MAKSSRQSRTGEWAVFGAGMLLCAAAMLALVFSGCAGASPRRGASQPAAAAEPGRPAVAGETSGSSKRFAEPGELDKLLDAKPIALAAVRPASAPGAPAKAPEPVAKGKANFRIQIGAESDLDAAQAKKAEYEKQLGGAVDVVFDAPFYKLRWGFFESKQDAEDKLLELSDFKIQGFVVKQ
jgi:hypothetical protein